MGPVGENSRAWGFRVLKQGFGLRDKASLGLQGFGGFDFQGLGFGAQLEARTMALLKPGIPQAAGTSPKRDTE